MVRSDHAAVHGRCYPGMIWQRLAGQRAFFGQPLSGCSTERTGADLLTGRRASFIAIASKGAACLNDARPAIGSEALPTIYPPAQTKEFDVLGIEWCAARDDPDREALANAEVVTVSSGPPTSWVTVARCSASACCARRRCRPQLLHAVYGLGRQPLSAANLIALHENARLGADARSPVLVGVKLARARPASPAAAVRGRVRGLRI
jgi:hypothetical protein